jgi:hypothetical protein
MDAAQQNGHERGIPATVSFISEQNWAVQMQQFRNN